tara:strand:+ start:14658 stop:15821 length:1164 start_codon:yes stop_codon:yes gene_type:complete
MNKWVDLETRHGSGAYGGWPISLVKGEGSYVWDSQGKKYLDFSTSIGAASLGHANPGLCNAIAEQSSKLLTANNGYFANDIRAQYLKSLASIAPGKINKIFLCNSGTEAVEGAIKLSRSYTGRSKIVSCVRGYHGRTLGALTATWQKDIRELFGPLIPDINHIPFGKSEILAENITEETAAVILEPIQGEAGIYPAPEGYLQAVRDICDQTGTLMILDEVQTGIGRTGKWFACDHANIIPDIITVAKALGGGIPIGAFLMKEEISFDRKKHGSTYGGSPFVCRVGLEVINQIKEKNILSNVNKMGNYFISGLNEIVLDHPNTFRETRGLGLMVAIQLRKPDGEILLKLMESGVLALKAGSRNLRFLPPFNVSKEEIDICLKALSSVL